MLGLGRAEKEAWMPVGDLLPLSSALTQVVLELGNTQEPPGSIKSNDTCIKPTVSDYEPQVRPRV